MSKYLITMKGIKTFTKGALISMYFCSYHMYVKKQIKK